MRQFLQQEQCVHEHIAFGMKLRRLFHSLHGRNLGQHLLQQSGFVEQEKSLASLALGEHLGQLVAHPLL